MRNLAFIVILTVSPASLADGLHDDVAAFEHAGTPWESLVIARCKRELRDAGARHVSMMRPHRVRRLTQKGKLVGRCYVPQRVRWRRGPGSIRYSGYVVVNCRMALAMAEFERAVQSTAARVFGAGRRVSRIRDLGSYSCRAIRGHARLSEHAFGNALDVAAFTITGYGDVSVRRHWSSSSPRDQLGRRFLRELVAELRRRRTFSTILDPSYDKAHRNHLHLDLNFVRMGLSEW